MVCVRYPLSPVCNPLSPVCYPLSPVCYPLSPVCYPLSPVCYPLSPVCYLLSLVCYPLSPVCYPLSPVCYPLSPLLHLNVRMHVTFSAGIQIYWQPTNRRHLNYNQSTKNGDSNFQNITIIIQWNLDNSNCRGPPKSLSYKKFELWVMLSLCISHVAIVMSPFRFSVFHSLAKLSKMCDIFLCEKNVNISSHRKGNLIALTTVYQFDLWLNLRDIPSKLSLPRPGPWNLVWVKQVFELSEVELSEFHFTWS